MEEQQGKKRGLFAPIVLLLLTFSLIGNVFLYADQLQTKQQDEQSEGMQLIKQAADTKLYFTSVQQQVGRLLESNDAASRLAAAYGLGLAVRHADSLRGLIEAASLRQVNSGLQEQALAFLDQREKSLGGIASQSGPITEEERTYLTSVREMYTKLLNIANGIDTEFNTKTAALKMQAGSKWIEIVNSLMTDMGKFKIDG